MDIKIFSLSVGLRNVTEVSGMIADSVLTFRATGAEFWIRRGHYQSEPLALWRVIIAICIREGIDRQSLERAK